MLIGLRQSDPLPHRGLSAIDKVGTWETIAVVCVMWMHVAGRAGFLPIFNYFFIRRTQAGDLNEIKTFCKAEKRVQQEK